MKQEDLLNSYNLLLCVMELLYGEICKLELDELVNPQLSTFVLPYIELDSFF